MMLASGVRLGPYEVVAPIGAGGMGEVYKVKDTRLDRIVALKVLPAHLAESAERRQRFEREARAVSALSHPHVCALYDVGQHDGTPYLVMEYLEGETLTERIARGPVPLEQLLRIAAEIAAGLDAAHRSGIVHRDLKPGNVLLTRSGVKLLDFGLAKIVAPPFGGISELSTLPTEAATSALTGRGVVMGTVPYMSPEQLEGKEADARSDLFALGAVLFEMATGRRAFEGSQASVVAAILSADPPPVCSLRPRTPLAFERLVKACLAKNPDDRWQTAHDLMLGLGGIAEGGGVDAGAAPVSAQRGNGRIAWGVAAVLLLGLLGVLVSRPRPSPAPVVRFVVPAPAGSTFNFIGRDAGPLAVSPDGSRVAFVATASDGRKLLFVRALDALDASALPGTDGATYPFWSPDCRFIGFFADGRLKKIPASGGAVQTLCDASMARGGTWSRQDVIVFAPGAYGPLSRVSAAGGVPSAVTRLDESRLENSHRWPVFLPDGMHFLYLARGSVAKVEASGNSLWLGSVEAGAIRRLRSGNSSLAYAPPGVVLFVDEGNLVVAPFDVKRLEFTGEALPVASKVQHYLNTSSAVFSVSANVLAYQADAVPVVSQITWFDRSGRSVGPAGPPDDYEDPAISPDGRSVTAMRIDRMTGGASIWLSDSQQGAFRRLTAAGAFNHTPIWSPDGRRIVYEADRAGASDFYARQRSGTGADELLLSSNEQASLNDWSPDGRYVAYQMLSPKTKWDLWLLPLSGDRRPVPFLQTDANETTGRFSPDGKWMAYAADESGRSEVYVVPFPGPGGKWQVSSEGGAQPRWSRDGRELFYLAGDRKLMSVSIAPGSTFAAAAPKTLFQTRSRYTGGAYDVSPDGKSFVVNTLAEESAVPITVVVNWLTEHTEPPK
jgi:Tol biopolymer transport system component